MRKRPVSRETFSRRLERLMAHKGMSVRAAAKIAGVPRSTVQDWRSGAQPSDFHAVRTLAQALGTSLSFLLTGEADAPASGASVSEVFIEDGTLFEGYCQVVIKRLVPRGEAP